MNNIFNDDDLLFVKKIYGEKIYSFLESKNLTIGFFSESENYVDEIIPESKGLIQIDDFYFSVVQDFSFDQKNLIFDFNYCKVGNLKFIKIVTPFTRDRSYDFILSKTEDIKEIIKELTSRKNKSFIKRIPSYLIGVPVKEIESKTIDFLLNEELRNFCKRREIPLKRGIIFEGAPGVGKSAVLKHLKVKAENNNIEFEVFNEIKEFLENSTDYYKEEKKIFVFEDFDTALLDRDNTGGTPNQVLGKILNTLDGVREIDNVVSIFTTNKIKLFDDAFIRPGRIDTVFTFSLPSEDNIKEFLDIYLFDFDKNFIFNIIKESMSNTNISYALLKGISDDLNIYNFFENKNPNNQEMEKIILNRITQTQKGENSQTTDFIL